ncbi:Flavin-dependent monooxygenase, reductase subunit HsaB [Corynebacterium occultum]|uniref:Flavin-dependent monooxygenase, reductase subunit HsaB n=1 Tax=Corynebacterium occultum TaxID=2675219 RepID=A0A6B8WAA6_9CORY|nr:flavin reductase family protein [Corynebacterium occultum]QGU06930.1 Flavin-dependent monooxygenase, reductase subunit HsaB [Corynebacterium occultum]
MTTTLDLQTFELPSVDIDPLLFRRTLGGYPTGVSVITVAGNGGPSGMVVGTFTSISLDPPIVGFFPKRDSSTLTDIIQAGHFCVNVLGTEHEHLSRKFCGPREERFEGVPTTRGATGAPRLDEALLWIDCTLERVVPVGDHVLVTGRVHDLSENNDQMDPLVFHRGGYFGLNPQ